MHRVAVVVLATATVATAAGKHDPRAYPGWRLYDRLCLPCHGAAGDGRGPAAPYSWGAPRAFTRGTYAWRSTPTGQPPSDDDLRATIRYGAPGTSMPAFELVLSDVEIDRVIDVVKAFDPASFAKPGKSIVVGPPRLSDAERGANLWKKQGCDTCHGATGRGDGPAAQSARPYDLTTEPLHRPRAADDRDTRRRAAMLSIATGMAGTPMPAFAGSLSNADLWALADHVVTLGTNAKPRANAALDAAAIAGDQLSIGTWPARDRDEERVFGAAVPPQGTAPPQLAPAEASLSARQCARCHAKQAREWQPSVHAASTTWGLGAREADHAGGDCARCHAPLAEQSDDRTLRDEGVTCAGCHVRDWTRRGPPRRAGSALAIRPGYPLVELAIYERSDFCMSCHQLPPRTAVNGKPLLNTYKEWLEGPYMRRGIQCQHCHMSDREHAWLGIHDRETFRQGIRLAGEAHRKDSTVTVAATLTNAGAGHYLPTTPTPAVWLRVELLDAKGRAIEGAHDELRIGREIEFATRWQEKRDTRIAPGEQITMTRAWRAGRVAEATSARITVEVRPDDYYERLYTERLRGTLPASLRAMYQAALARTVASHYIAEKREVPL